jgi:hypothetical protein
VSQNLNGIAKKNYLPTVRDASGLIPLVNNMSFPIATTPEFDQYQFSVKGDQIINSSQKISGSASDGDSERGVRRESDRLRVRELSAAW